MKSQRVQMTNFGMAIIMIYLGTSSLAIACDEHTKGIVLAKSQTESKLTELYIPKVSCISCAYKIRKALKPMAGVESIKVDPDTQTLRFSCDKCDMSEVKAKLEEIGYPVGERT